MANNTCEKCNKNFKTNRNLQRHMLSPMHLRGGKKTLEEKKIHLCDICKYKTVSPYKLQRHFKTKLHSKKSKLTLNKLQNAMKKFRKKKNKEKIEEFRKLINQHQHSFALS